MTENKLSDRYIYARLRTLPFEIMFFLIIAVIFLLEGIYSQDNDMESIYLTFIALLFVILGYYKKYIKPVLNRGYSLTQVMSVIDNKKISAAIMGLVFLIAILGTKMNVMAITAVNKGLPQKEVSEGFYYDLGLGVLLLVIVLVLINLANRVTSKNLAKLPADFKLEDVIKK